MPTQAICTKYHGPTDRRGSRIIATTASGVRATVPYDQELDTFEAHRKGALELQKKLGWKGNYVGGGTKDGYCFVECPSGRRR